MRGKERSMRHLGLCLLLALCWSICPAQARNWSHDPASLAQDYSVIVDSRSPGEQVIIFWMNPAMLPPDPASKAAEELLGKYVILGVIHSHASKDGTMSFAPVPTLSVTNKAGKPLKFLDDNALPPSALAARTTLQTIFTRALGPAGEGTHWFAFEAGSVVACGKAGGLRIPFVGETYTYDTPIPGCH